MKNNENKKNNKTLFVALGVVLMAVVGIVVFQLTYAFFSANIKDMNPDNEDVEVISADLEVKYHDGSSNIALGGKIEPGSVIEKEFSVENTGNDTGYYTIVLENLENHFDREREDTETSESDFTYSLYKINNNVESVIATGNIPLALTPTTLTIYQNDSVKVNTTTKYKLKITYQNLANIDQSDDMGSLLEAKVNIVESETERRTGA